MTPMTGRILPITSAVHRGADCRRFRTHRSGKKFCRLSRSHPSERVLERIFTEFHSASDLKEIVELMRLTSVDAGSAAHRGADFRRHHTQVLENCGGCPDYFPEAHLTAYLRRLSMCPDPQILKETVELPPASMARLIVGHCFGSAECPWAAEATRCVSFTFF